MKKIIKTNKHSAESSCITYRTKNRKNEMYLTRCKNSYMFPGLYECL